MTHYGNSTQEQCLCVPSPTTKYIKHLFFNLSHLRYSRGASLSEPHIVHCMAEVHVAMYVCNLYVHPVNFDVSARHNFFLILCLLGYRQLDKGCNTLYQSYHGNQTSHAGRYTHPMVSGY